ncbi:hypothetical protein BS78_05G216600 [Paspalum vaginatum]|nr:hypothetical protein BS78_05G216600 [Paspalum vaginatum]
MLSTAASTVGSGGHGDGEVLTTTSAIIAEALTGSHVLEIKGYSLFKGLGNGKFITSSEFSVGGHRWCIILSGTTLMAKPSDSADWISIYLHHDYTSCDAVEVKAQFGCSVLDDIGEPAPINMPRITVRQDICKEVPMQFVVVPLSDMRKHFGRLLSRAEGVDVTFEVAGELFPAHRCVLAARSSVLTAELFGPMKEKAMNHRIRIDDMEARVLKAMLDFIYMDAMPEIGKEDKFVMIQHLLVAADRYDLERLRLFCEEKLCNCVDTGTVATTLALAGQHRCHGLKKACFKFLESPSHLKKATATEGFDHLISSCPCLVKELLAKAYPCP